MIDYDAEIEKLRERIGRTQARMREPRPLRWKEQDPEKERIAAEKQERERQQGDAFNLASIEQDFRMIEVLQRERDKDARQRDRQASEPREGARTMGFNADVYRILIASPGDVSAERRAIPEVIHAWNDVHAADLGVVLLPVLWESHSAPEMGDRPQAIINRQLVASCDMLIGAFWTRIGSHTGLAESGTVEEIEQFRAAGKPVMLYFSSQPVTPAASTRTSTAASKTSRASASARA